MGDYTAMADHYDLIMTSGYYDYEAIVDSLDPHVATGSVLEIGAGTGLILERLAARCPGLDLSGVDITAAMLDIARQRLAKYPQVALHLQDVVVMDLDRRFDLAFSYGGVWYFVPDDDGFSMISHIPDDEANVQGLRRVADHLVVDGRLMLGVQARHVDYSSPVRGGLEYSQRIVPVEGGFRKEYRLEQHAAGRGRHALMEQTTAYRVYPRREAFALLDEAGFVPCDPVAGGAGLFVELLRR